MNIQNYDKYCFFWSKLAYFSPCNNSQPNILSTYRQSFKELNIEGFDFTNGVRCSDIHQFERLKKLSIKIFELSIYQDQNKRKHELIPIEIKKKIEL